MADPKDPAGGAGHDKGARPSTRARHETGDARRREDRGGEKGDENRTLPRRRPDGWIGSLASNGRVAMNNSRKFSLQIQFEPGAKAHPGLIDNVVDVVKQEGGRVTGVSVSEEGGEPFATVNVETQDANAFWRKAKPKLTTTPRSKLLKGMIIVCEGEDGWNDYLLLHHFDKTQEIDALRVTR